jgi:hypothetical protein
MEALSNAPEPQRETSLALAEPDNRKDMPLARGRWKPGQSGNPKGRPKASLVALQRDLEGAIREHLTADKVKRIVDAIVDKATHGDVKAAKLILDKLVPNATDADQGNQDAGRTVIFRVENATFLANQKKAPSVSVEIIDAEVVPKVPATETGK